MLLQRINPIANGLLLILKLGFVNSLKIVHQLMLETVIAVSLQKSPVKQPAIFKEIVRYFLFFNIMKYNTNVLD